MNQQEKLELELDKISKALVDIEVCETIPHDSYIVIEAVLQDYKKGMEELLGKLPEEVAQEKVEVPDFTGAGDALGTDR